MQKRILFVIPAYNEEKNIGKVINDINTEFKNADILVVNDCSKDNTLRALKDGGGYEYLDLPVNLGYSGALQTGFKYAMKNNYDYVIQFDGDGQHLACEAYKLYERIQRGDANIVIGSRFIEQTEYRHSFFRKIGTKIFTIIIKLLTNTVITDPTSGLQIIDRKTIYRYAQAGQYPEFPDANLLVRMIIEGFKIEEVPCKMVERTDGISMHAGLIKPVKYMIKNIYSLMLISIRLALTKLISKG